MAASFILSISVRSPLGLFSSSSMASRTNSGRSGSSLTLRLKIWWATSAWRCDQMKPRPKDNMPRLRCLRERSIRSASVIVRMRESDRDSRKLHSRLTCKARKMATSSSTGAMTYHHGGLLISRKTAPAPQAMAA